jgi:hypothetical protein
MVEPGVEAVLYRADAAQHIMAPEPPSTSTY